MLLHFRHRSSGNSIEKPYYAGRTAKRDKASVRRNIRSKDDVGFFADFYTCGCIVVAEEDNSISDVPV
jgi:hypothetical protein